MNIPESIRIGSCNYEVVFTDMDLVSNHMECYANIDYDKHLITISNKLGDTQTKELSLLHEMFHGIIKERNLDIGNEELVVEEFARSLHQIIRDNPNMFK